MKSHNILTVKFKGETFDMSNLSTISCSFYLSKRNSKGNTAIYPLNKKFSYKNEKKSITFSNFLEVMCDFFYSYGEFQKDDYKKKIFACSLSKSTKYFIEEKEKYTYVVGIIDSGEYGIVSEIRDIDTRKINHKRQVNEADIKQFYFMIAIAKDTSNTTVQKGLFIFQNIGQFGIKTITTTYLKEYLKNLFGITLHTGNIAPETYIEKLTENAYLDKLICVKNNVSIDSSDNLENGGAYGQETRIYSKLFNSKSLWGNIKEFIKKFSKNRHVLFEFEDIKYDKAKIVVEQNGYKRTINLHNIENLSIIEPLDSDIQLADGSIDEFRLLTSLHDLASFYIDNLVAEIIPEREKNE